MTRSRRRAWRGNWESSVVSSAISPGRSPLSISAWATHLRIADADAEIRVRGQLRDRVVATATSHGLRHGDLLDAMNLSVDIRQTGERSATGMGGERTGVRRQAPLTYA
jgi:hypothetical protein